MNDRELLELAAKAADIPFMGISHDGAVERADGGWWDPLADDGDALRLAATLCTSYGISSSTGRPRVAWFQFGKVIYLEMPGAESNQPLEDRTCWIRRAIVRAAAAIGEAMP